MTKHQTNSFFVDNGFTSVWVKTGPICNGTSCSIRWHTPHAVVETQFQKGERHNSEELVIQLELFPLNILKVWLVGKIKDRQETDVSYGMSHLLKSCLLSSVQLCRPRPSMCMCTCMRVCVCKHTRQSTAVFLCFLMERTGALNMIMLLLWDFNVHQTSDCPIWNERGQT